MPKETKYLRLRTLELTCSMTGKSVGSVMLASIVR